MAGMKQALLFASGGRYVVMLTGHCHRLDRCPFPDAGGVRRNGSPAAQFLASPRRCANWPRPPYLVQQRELTAAKIGTIFTVNLITTLVVAGLVIAVSVPLARLYGMAALEHYIYVMVMAYSTGPFVYPIFGLLCRGMAFQKIAAIDVLTALLNAAVTIGLLVQDLAT